MGKVIIDIICYVTRCFSTNQNFNYIHKQTVRVQYEKTQLQTTNQLSNNTIYNNFKIIKTHSQEYTEDKMET